MLLAFAYFSHVQITFHYVLVRAVPVPYSDCTCIYIWLSLNLFFLLSLQAPVLVLKTAYLQKLATKSRTNPDGLKLSCAEAVLAWSNATFYWYFKFITKWVYWSQPFKDALLRNDIINNAYQMEPHSLQFYIKSPVNEEAHGASHGPASTLFLCFCYLLVLFPAGERMLLARLACSPCCHWVLVEVKSYIWSALK